MGERFPNATTMPADSMSKRVLLLIFFLAATFSQSLGPKSFAIDERATLLTLYAHAPPPEDAAKGPILNALRQWGSQQAANLHDEAIFTLDPPFGGNFVLSGTTTLRLWVRADHRTFGNLSVFVTENMSNGTSILLLPPYSDPNTILDARPHDVNVGLVTLTNLTLVAGSTLQLHVRFSSTDTFTNAYLLYDSPTTPTQITIPTRGSINSKIELESSKGETGPIFEALTESANVSVLARITIEDFFGLYALSNARLTLSDSGGAIVAAYPNIFPSANNLTLYTATLDTNFSAPVGVYTLSLIITDRAGNSHITAEQFYVAAFYFANIRTIDSTNRAIEGARVLLSSPISEYTASTNETGWASLRVPSSRIVGTYEASVSWKNLTLIVALALSVEGHTIYPVVFQAFDVTINTSLLGFDFAGAFVNLVNNSNTVATGSTNSSGTVVFTQIPSGDYRAVIHYLGVEHEISLGVSEPTSITVQLPFPYQQQLPYAGLLVIVVAAVAVVTRRRRRIYESPFSYLDVLTKGGLPDSCTATIIGGSGSGKTVIMESLANEGLKSGRGCVYVTNVELPSDLRAGMATIGIDLSEYEAKGKLLYVDCYSALSGTPSKEKRALSSFTDLTSLGILITSAIEDVGGVVDVYLDSLTSLFTTLKSDYVISFLQSVGAKVKSYNGRLCTSMGTSVDNETVTKVEEISDCVIETHLSEGRPGQIRRLRIKKMRGRSYNAGWTKFNITEAGIMFLTPKAFDKMR